MKKKVLSFILASTVLLSACASKDADKKKKDSEPDEETEVTEEETSEETTTEETTKETEATEPSESEAEPEEGIHTAKWIDLNLNFGHDAGDGYLINGSNVSMADFYAALESDDVMKCFDAYERLYKSPLQNYDMYSALSDCEYVTTTEIELESPGVEVGATSTDNVRIDEENCMTYYTVTIPQIDLGTSDSDKANQEIVEFVEKYDPWYGMPNVRYQHIEHEDGSKTVVVFYGDGYDDSMFKSFSFDADGKRMKTEDIVKSAGWDSSTFSEDAQTYLAQTLAYGNEFAIECQGWGFWESYIAEDIADPDVFVNANGNLVILIHTQITGNPGCPCIPFAMEKDLELSDEVLEEEFDYEPYEWEVERTKTFVVGGGEEIVSDKTIDDIDLTDGSQATEKYGVLRFTGGSDFTLDSDEDTNNGKITGFFEVVLGNAVTEDSTYKYEVYLDGELELTGSVTVKAEPFFRYFSFTYERENKEGVRCVVLYDANDSDKVIAADWLE